MRNILIIIILLVLLKQVNSITCHNSCTSCETTMYNSCHTCVSGGDLTYEIIHGSFPKGTCAPLVTASHNALGVCVIITVIVMAIIINNQEIIYLALFLQSLGLIYLVEVGWSQGVDYILSALTYLMVFTRATLGSKLDLYPNESTDVIKGRLFFGQFDISANIQGVGIANIIVVLLLFLIAIFKPIRRKCTSQRVRCMPDWILQKASLVLNAVFIFLIQETTAVVYFSLKYGHNLPVEVGLGILYFSCLLVFTVNQFIYPPPYFRSRGVQLNMIIGKMLTPFFLAISTSQAYQCFIFLLIIWTIDFALTHNNKRSNQYNRQIFYKVIGLGVLIMLTIYYAIDVLINNTNTSKIVGIVSTVLLSIQLYFPIFQSTLRCKQYYCNKQQTNSASENKSGTQKKKILKNGTQGTDDVTLENIHVEIPHIDSQQHRRESHINQRFDQEMQRQEEIGNHFTNYKFNLNFQQNTMPVLLQRDSSREAEGRDDRESSGFSEFKKVQIIEIRPSDQQTSIVKVQQSIQEVQLPIFSSPSPLQRQKQIVDKQELFVIKKQLESIQFQEKKESQVSKKPSKKHRSKRRKQQKTQF